MKLLKNPAIFVVLYILFMLPTYYLPYLGSNSSIIDSLAKAGGATFNPYFWIHLLALIALIFIAWFRGSLIEKKWLVIFPILATVFDMMPALNFIPLVPTVMHLLAIILGVTGVQAVISKENTKLG